MVDPDNEDRLLKIPLRVVAAIQAEAEQRVLFDVQHRTFQHAWNAGVTAARDAVAGLRGENENVLPRQFKARALTAIDKLIGDNHA